MWNWLSQNAQLLNTFLNLGMLLIWGIYLQLLLNNFRRQRHAKLIINRGRGRGMDSLCIVSNMSQEPIFLEAIVGVIETSDGTYVYDVTDYTDENQKSKEDKQDAPELRQVTRQGPLSQGQYIQIGSYRQLMKGVALHHGIDVGSQSLPQGEMTFKSFELRLIGLFGPEDQPIGARRCFNIEKSDNDEYVLVPKTVNTVQLSSHRDRREIRRWMNDTM
ncbi:hypothetical protein [Phytohalomonas tamaricis]|uniref:hypothetical protein n=1 Tax=Phytohalomonas tamaricis TaxID=2081032 RepID=UPI000D0BAE91|nr:hypothetical protein [Phytohalomonas tamaricis]